MLRDFSKALTAACLLTVAASTVDAHAVTLTIPASKVGWYDDTVGLGFPRIDNYFTGYSGPPGGTSSEHRGFFVFDLSSLAALPQSLVVGAAIELSSGDIALQLSEPNLVRLFDVSNPNALGVVSFSPALFDDLGGGVAYGEYVYQLSDAGVERSLGLNEAAVASINAVANSVNQTFAVGGRLMSPAPLGSNPSHYAFGFSAGLPAPNLILTIATIPEPTSLALVAMLGVCGMMRRRPNN